jgi:hypothetical protein
LSIGVSLLFLYDIVLGQCHADDGAVTAWLFGLVVVSGAANVGVLLR